MLGERQFDIMLQLLEHGGFITLPDLKKAITGYSKLNSSTMSNELYRIKRAELKQIILSVRSLEKRGYVALRYKPSLAKTKRIESLLLTEAGIRSDPPYLCELDEEDEGFWISYLNEGPDKVTTYTEDGRFFRTYDRGGVIH